MMLQVYTKLKCLLYRFGQKVRWDSCNIWHVYTYIYTHAYTFSDFFPLQLLYIIIGY